MMLVIDESTVLSYNLNSYYELLPGEDGTGIVKFPIPALEPGKHTAEFWVWDILNNSTVRTFTFEVVEGLKPFLFDVIATPGIAREQVTFHLMHNRPEVGCEWVLWSTIWQADNFGNMKKAERPVCSKTIRFPGI